MATYNSISTAGKSREDEFTEPLSRLNDRQRKLLESLYTPMRPTHLANVAGRKYDGPFQKDLTLIENTGLIFVANYFFPCRLDSNRTSRLRETRKTILYRPGQEEAAADKLLLYVPEAEDISEEKKLEILRITRKMEKRLAEVIQNRYGLTVVASKKSSGEKDIEAIKIKH